MRRRRCSTRGCAEPVHARGLCSRHYWHWRRRQHVENERRCSVAGCGRPHLARGWCRRHYRRWFEEHRPPPRPARPATCSIAGCERPHAARGWCELHYERWRRHGDPLVVKGPGRAVGERNGARTHPERVPRGERVGTAKLTPRAVRAIRALAANGRTYHELGQRYGVTAGAVSHVVNRRNWRHVA